jgi:uncharacterized protein YdeI (YjbR/CyaY-like superfamily)
MPRASPSKALKTFDARSAAGWRRWLETHHESESEVWLVFYRRHTGRPSIAYADALDEALCFGWIDSLIRRLDDARYARKFTPRKATSTWSASNRERYAQLRSAGRMAPAGLRRPPTARSSERPPAPATLPRYIREALGKRPPARKAFESLAPSHKRTYVGWIDSAKRVETKLRRLRQAIELLSAGKKLGLK